MTNLTFQSIQSDRRYKIKRRPIDVPLPHTIKCHGNVPHHFETGEASPEFPTKVSGNLHQLLAGLTKRVFRYGVSF